MGFKAYASLVFVLLIAAIAGGVYWQTRDDDVQRPIPTATLMPNHTFTRIEDAESAVGFKLPLVRELNGWKLRRVEVSPTNLIFIKQPCARPEDCSEPPAVVVALEYEPPAPGPTLNVLIFKATQQLDALAGRGDGRSVDIPGGTAVLKEERVADGRVTSLRLFWVRSGLQLLASATFVTNPTGSAYERGLLGTLSTDEFLAMMRSIR